MMYNESITLRGLNNLFSENTVITFFVVIVFLFLADYFYNKVSLVPTKRWLNHYLSGLSAIASLVTFLILIKIMAGIVEHYRFNSLDTNNVSLTQVISGASVCILFSFIYLFHVWLKTRLFNVVNNPLKRAVYEALLALSIVSLVSMLIHISVNLSNGVKISSQLIFLDVAIRAPLTIGAALAIFIHSYYLYLNTISAQEKELQIVRLQQQVAQTQLDVLSSKINPHFLYNALNSIAGLATEDGIKTRDMAIALAKLFRYNINKRTSSLATVKEEMEMVSHYLEIEKIRFEEKLQYHSDIQHGIGDELLPMNLIQPLVENAVKHGYGDEGVDINVIIKKVDGNLMIGVQDKGKPFDTAFNPGYGLKSLYDKLDILAPGQYEISFLNDPKEVRIQIGQLKTNP